MSGYTKKDAAKDTESTVKEVSRAHHQARNDAAKEGGWGVPKDRHEDDNKPEESNKDDDSEKE